MRILRPVITEQSMKNVAKNKFTFYVDLNSTKTEIKNEVKKLFNVNPVSIYSYVLKGRTMRSGAKRTLKKLSNLKKVVVKLKTGEKIDLFEGEK